MSKFPAITPKKLITFLKANNFIIDHTSGSHIVLYNEIAKKRAIVPFHRKYLPKGTILAILKEAGFSKKNYLNYK